MISMSKEDHRVHYTTVSIPIPLIEKIKGRMMGTGFSSVSSYVTYILRQVLSSIEEDDKSRQAFTKEEEDTVKRRLRELGYID